MKSRFESVSILVLISLAAVGCGGSNSSEDTSTSGLVAGAAGGAMSNSEANGSQAFFQTHPSLWQRAGSAMNPISTAMASNSCPTYRSMGADCASSGGNMWLTLDDCSYSSAATWDGVIAMIPSSANASCGTFPNPGFGGNLIRQVVTTSGALTPGTLTLTSAAGISATIDDASANLSNYDGASIPVIANGGYGSQVDFDGTSGARSSVSVNHRILSTGLFDYSIAGSLMVSEQVGATSRTLTGNLTVYHNLLKIIGTATFNNVTHEDGCCFPVSGSISTVFSAGTVNPTNAGAKLVGETEVLTFTGCGTATYQAPGGSSSTNVTLNRCF